MRYFLPLCAALAVTMTAPVGAVSLSQESLSQMTSSDVVLLGEFHDNPRHHQVQSDLVQDIAPKALVFEMLTPDQASRVTAEIRGQADALSAALNWAESGWPNFSMYHPIFLAAPNAAIYGAAVPRDQARQAMEQGVSVSFGLEAEAFGLTTPLAETEQTQRERLQFEAHCNALPEHLLPAMVDIQRLRDARLAQASVQALDATGGPVVVITGNGHARADWGVPRFLRRVRPDLAVFALGQSEDAALLPGLFDAVLDAPSIERPDPCEAFRN